MELGESRIVNFIFRYISKEMREELEDYVQNTYLEKFYGIDTLEQIDILFRKQKNDILEQIKESDLLDLRCYTGYHFREINAILRGNWTYEQNGLLTNQLSNKYYLLADRISKIIEKSSAVGVNFITYRGVDIEAFSKYGISTLEQLIYMKEKYVYEEGFTSTSLLEKTSYFGKKLVDGKLCNIEIQYFIPADWSEGLFLAENMSYSPTQYEYLINKSTLSKVMEVLIEQDKNQAIMKMMVIPTKRWDIYYKNKKYGNKR